MTTGEFFGVMLTGIGLLAGQVILEVRTMDLSTRLVALEKPRGGAGMSWNYRVIKHQGWFGIHEVYYRRGKPCLWAERPELRAETLGELLRLTGSHLVASHGKLRKRVLDEAEMLEGDE